jgi:hypothetical protein
MCFFYIEEEEVCDMLTHAFSWSCAQIRCEVGSKSRLQTDDLDLDSAAPRALKKRCLDWAPRHFRSFSEYFDMCKIVWNRKRHRL